MKCQILTRGLIPGIMIRGPVANIELAFDTICELLDRGVDVRREDGSPFDRIPLEEQPKKEMVITVPAEKTFKLPRVPELELGGHPDPVGAPGTPGVPDPEVQAMVHASAEATVEKTASESSEPIVHEIVKHSADVLAEQQKAAYAAESADASPDDLESEDDDEAPAPANTDSANPYAGMSKNQAKKARRAAAAKAAAEAAAKSGNSTPQ